MKRFIDLRGQLYDYDDDDTVFAWFDTITDRFEQFGEYQVWDTWSEFERDYDGHQLERYRGLCPDWVRGNR